MDTLQLLLVALAAGVGSWAWTSMTGWPARRVLRQREQLHWSDVARRIHADRMGMAAVAVFLPADCALAVYLWRHPGVFWILAVGLLSAIGVTLGAWPLKRALEHGSRKERWWVTPLKNPALFYGVLIVAMPRDFGAVTWVLFGGVIGYLIAGQIWPIPISRPFRRLAAPSAEVEALIRDVSEKSGIRVRRAWVVEVPQSTAVALPFSKEIVVTSRIVEILSPAELRAVVAHELEHLRESFALSFVRVLVAYSSLPLLLVKPVCATWGPQGLGLLVLLWIAPRFLFSRWSIRQENKADQTGAREDAAALASALLRLHEDNLVPAVLEQKSSHPDLYDRMIACGVTPDFPRPKPAASHTLAGTVAAGALGVLAMMAVIEWTR